MSEQDNFQALLDKLDNLQSTDGSKVNQIIMLCLQAFTIMFVMLKPLCTMYIKAKYKFKEDSRNSRPSSDL